MRAWSKLGLGIVLMLAMSVPAFADGAAVGDDAPEITATTWMNTPDGEHPLEGDADPKLVLIEFWGTWCGPCVRAMPKIQALWERYKDMGVIVIAMTREKPGEIRGFVEEHGYTMPIACDPSQSCIGEFAIQGWPTSVLLDRDHKVLWRGSPSGAEAQIEKALGLESSPTTLLIDYLDACLGKDKDAKRKVLERLVEKAPSSMDLTAFAERVLGEAPEEPAEAAKPLKSKAATKLLDRIAKAWSDAAKRAPLLTEMAQGHEPIDLAAWAAAAFRKAYPFKSKELDGLLEAGKHGALVDMFILRAPSSSLWKKAAKDDAFARYCDKNSSDAWTFARKAKMARMYWMRDEGELEDFDHENFDSEAFSRDLAISGAMMNKERNRIMGVIIAGEPVTKDAASAYVRKQLARFFVMNAIASGNALKPAKLEKSINQEIEKIVKALRKKYG